MDNFSFSYVMASGPLWLCTTITTCYCVVGMPRYFGCSYLYTVPQQCQVPARNIWFGKRDGIEISNGIF